MIEGLHPSLILIIGGALLMAVRGGARAWLTVALPVISYIHFMGLEVGMDGHHMMAGISLHVLHVDKMALLFGTLFHVAALIAGILPCQRSGAAFYRNDVCGQCSGAVLAGDFRHCLSSKLLAVICIPDLTGRPHASW